MWTTEGKGKIPPTPLIVRLESSDFAAAREATRRREGIRAYSKRSDAWGKGMLESKDPVLIGTLGEIAFARWASGVVGKTISPDMADRIKGDGGKDFDVCGYRIQVKTAASDYDSLLVRTLEMEVSEWVICVRAHYPPRSVHAVDNGVALFDPGDSEDAAVALCGWAYKGTIYDRGKLTVGKAGQANYKLSPREFCPMKDLGDLFQARKGLAS